MGDEIDGLGYADSLPFLLSQIGARIARRFAELIAPLGLTPREFGALANLSGAEGQSQQQLADTLGLHRNSMVGLVDDLEAAGLIRRARHPDDRRAFALTLTPRGRELVAEADALIPGLEREVAGRLSRAERARLAGQLHEVADGLGLTPAVHPEIAQRRGDPAPRGRTARPRPSATG